MRKLSIILVGIMLLSLSSCSKEDDNEESITKDLSTTTVSATTTLSNQTSASKESEHQTSTSTKSEQMNSTIEETEIIIDFDEIKGLSQVQAIQWLENNLDYTSHSDYDVHYYENVATVLYQNYSKQQLKMYGIVWGHCELDTRTTDDYTFRITYCFSDIDNYSNKSKYKTKEECHVAYEMVYKEIVKVFGNPDIDLNANKNANDLWYNNSDVWILDNGMELWLGDVSQDTINEVYLSFSESESTFDYDTLITKND